MAAGNDNRLKVPFPVAFSVSAVADFDGQAGGAGEPTCRQDEDDTLANFSNFGEKIDIAAPGVCILSTWNNGGYNIISGTSMAAPHVTGAVALYLHANGLAPAQDAGGVAAIEQAIINAAHPQGTDNHDCSYDDDRIGGPMLFVNHPNFGGDGSCEVAPGG
jgi:subtilisin